MDNGFRVSKVAAKDVPPPPGRGKYEALWEQIRGLTDGALCLETPDQSTTLRVLQAIYAQRKRRGENWKVSRQGQTIYISK